MQPAKARKAPDPQFPVQLGRSSAWVGLIYFFVMPWGYWYGDQGESRIRIGNKVTFWTLGSKEEGLLLLLFLAASILVLAATYLKVQQVRPSNMILAAAAMAVVAAYFFRDIMKTPATALKALTSVGIPAVSVEESGNHWIVWLVIIGYLGSGLFMRKEGN